MSSNSAPHGREPDVTSRRWRPAAVGLGVGLVAVFATLVIPVAFSDPNGVDPYSLRLAAVSAALLVIAWWTPRLAAMRPALLALAGVIVPFALWSGTPAALVAIFAKSAPSGWAQLFWASAVEVVATVGFCLLTRRLAKDLRPDFRMRITPTAVATGVVGIALFVLVVMLIPAEVLGRVGIAPVAVARNAPWLIPADLLLGAVQELQFRGLMMGTLERVMPRHAANAVQALVFGLGHLAVVYQGPEAPFVPLTVVLGLVLGYVTQKTRSIWPAFMVHGVADVLVDVFVMGGLYGL